MSKVDGMPVNFTISVDGKAAIERFRAEWDADLPSPAAVAVIGWSHVIPDGGPPSDGVFFTFYSQEEYPGIAHGVEEASGSGSRFSSHARTTGNSPERPSISRKHGSSFCAIDADPLIPERRLL